MLVCELGIRPTPDPGSKCDKLEPSSQCVCSAFWLARKPTEFGKEICSLQLCSRADQTTWNHAAMHLAAPRSAAHQIGAAFFVGLQRLGTTSVRALAANIFEELRRSLV